MSGALRPPDSRTDREQLIGALVPRPDRTATAVATTAVSSAVAAAADRRCAGYCPARHGPPRSLRTCLCPAVARCFGLERRPPCRHRRVAGVLVVASTPGGLHIVGDRGVLTLPAAARSMCHIGRGEPVVVLASLLQNVLVVHPANTVTGAARPASRSSGGTGTALGSAECAPSRGLTNGIRAHYRHTMTPVRSHRQPFQRRVAGVSPVLRTPVPDGMLCDRTP
jgi:hypothetical protein